MSSAGKSPETLEPEDWAGEMGERWNRNIEQFESMLTAVGSAAIEFAELRRGESVIDIGCGGGATTLEIAKRVGAAGSATGVDVSATLIATAKSRQKAAHIDNARFMMGDAATLQFDRKYECLFSRFGIMFFADPYAAFANLASALASGGRAALCCWGPPAANPWVAQLIEVVRRHVSMPPRDPRAPGPFALADRDYLCDILEKAGFSDIELTIWKGDQYLGGLGADAAAATQFALNATFMREMLAEQPADTKRAVETEILEMLRKHETARGVTLKGTAWLVGARV